MTNHATGAAVTIRAKRILSVEGWENAGLRSHPDERFVDKIISGTTYGVNIKYKGPQVSHMSDNWKSAYILRDVVINSLHRDVKLGRKAGPFRQPPFENFVVSPMGAFKRKRSDKYRVIHDLSWPPGRSINDFISEDDSSVDYISVNQITDVIKRSGPGMYMARLDIADAYKHIRVRAEDWHLLGASWTNENGETLYYFDQTLPFGLRSSALVFTEFAQALKYVMLNNGVTHVEQYLDDFITCAPTFHECKRNLEIMISMCDMIGFTVNYDKVFGPSTVLEFLGIVLDSVNMETRVSPDRVSDILSELRSFYELRVCTKRKLLSLIGKLVFVSRVVKSGRSFVRRMIETSKHVKHLHHKVKLRRQFRDDIAWWLYFLPCWNGVSMIADDIWSNSTKLQLFTDASDLAVSAFFEGRWCVIPIQGAFAYLAHTSINFRELYAIVMALATWGRVLSGSKVSLNCDNLSVCQIINSGTSKSGDIMKLVRVLFFVCALYDIECRAEHLYTFDNSIADSLSRLNFDKFYSIVPYSRTCHVIPTIIDWCKF